MYGITTAVNKIISLEKRIKVIKGGTSAGKTIAILIILIDKAIKKDSLEISVVAESIPHLKRGAQKDFIKIMRSTGRWNPDSWNKTDRLYTFPNNSVIEFFSADKDEKLRGARRDVLYINECNNVEFEAYTELEIRTKSEIYLDYNPVTEFWVNEHLTDDPNSEFITLTYLDNEALDPSIKASIEAKREKAKKSDYWRNWFNVFGLGLEGKIEGLIFQNLEYFEYNPIDFVHGYNYAFIDPANGGGDYFCCLIFSVLNDKIHMIDAIYSKKDSTYTMPLLKNKLEQYNISLVGCETNGGGAMFFKFCKDLGYPVRKIVASVNSKASRIIASAYFISVIKFARHSTNDYNNALYDIERFTLEKKGKPKNDDAPDCLAMAIKTLKTEYNYIFTNDFINNNIKI